MTEKPVDVVKEAQARQEEVRNLSMLVLDGDALGRELIQNRAEEERVAFKEVERKLTPRTLRRHDQSYKSGSDAEKVVAVALQCAATTTQTTPQQERLMRMVASETAKATAEVEAGSKLQEVLDEHHHTLDRLHELEVQFREQQRTLDRERSQKARIEKERRTESQRMHARLERSTTELRREQS